MTKTVIFATRLVRMIARLVVVHVVQAHVFPNWRKLVLEDRRRIYRLFYASRWKQASFLEFCGPKIRQELMRRRTSHQMRFSRRSENVFRQILWDDKKTYAFTASLAHTAGNCTEISLIDFNQSAHQNTFRLRPSFRLVKLLNFFR